ncbi:glycosyltransferase [Limosilactobacillus pontis]|uniref:glycosyltransferase family 2 protein n=1 Tax=Limosilactobacillus pontis TaxID=35787 RepID=UPI002F264D67
MKNKCENLVSIIVPIYNSEESLDRCLTSLINQTYTNIEIILVNDGSTDESLEICDKYGRYDDRILIIDQGNCGRAVARNVGINIASGDYVMFVDSDDYVSKEFCKDALRTICKYNVDIVLFDYYLEEKNTSLLKKTCNESGFLSKNKAMSTVVDASFLQIKIFRKNLFKGITFPVGKNYEDVFVTYQLIDKAESFYHLPRPLYHYVQHANSVTHIKNSQNVSDFFEASYIRFNFLKQFFPLVANQAQQSLKLLSFYYLIYNQNGYYYSEALSIFNSDTKLCNISKKLCLIILLYRIFPTLARNIVKLYFKYR